MAILDLILCFHWSKICIISVNRILLADLECKKTGSAGGKQHFRNSTTYPTVRKLYEVVSTLGLDVHHWILDSAFVFELPPLLMREPL